MRRILFVDDEPNILDGLRRMLRTMRHEWQMEFAVSGVDAIALVDRAPFDVVVSDMRMPGMDGAELQTQVMLRCPQTVRIILSGQSDWELILKAVGPAHQFLAKPCDAEQLKRTVAKSCQLRDRLADDRLVRVASQMRTLPSLPANYQAVLAEIASPNCSLRTVGEWIARDVAMTAQMLHLSNAWFFGLSRAVADPVQATTLLGLESMRSLALSVRVFAPYEGSEVGGFAIGYLCQHSARVARLARAIAEAMGCDRAAVDATYAAGLLHDVGYLLLVANVADAFAEAVAVAREQRVPLAEAEERVIGASHAALGAYLLGLWGLPDAIVETVLHHHAPRAAGPPAIGPLAAVHLAEVLVHEQSDDVLRLLAGEVDLDYLRAVGLSDRIDEFRALERATAAAAAAGPGVSDRSRNAADAQAAESVSPVARGMGTTVDAAVPGDISPSESFPCNALS